MKPVVHGLEAEYGDQIEFVYLDIDDKATAAFKQQLNFRSQPYFVMLDGEGNVVETLNGSANRDDFVNAFKGLTGASSF
jgi:thiol-disulfide isomerase/thioredoxin